MIQLIIFHHFLYFLGTQDPKVLGEDAMLQHKFLGLGYDI
jgi:hypothetical protein